MKYVIKNLDTKRFVSRSGSKSSYVRELQHARTWDDREAAKRQFRIVDDSTKND